MLDNYLIVSVPIPFKLSPIRAVFRICSNIYDGAFCENSYRFSNFGLAYKYASAKCFTLLWIPSKIISRHCRGLHIIF